MSTDPAPGSRAKFPVENGEVGEEMHHCGYCGSRTIMDDGLHYATGAINHDCPNCGQRYALTDEDDGFDPADPGDIEVVDADGNVVGTTAPPKPGMEAPDLDTLLAQLNGALPEASQEDLNHLFGIKPAPASPYGEDFGSFG